MLLLWDLLRGLSDKRHCLKMWRQFVTKVPTADRSWHERDDNLRKWQSIFDFDKATTALFFLRRRHDFHDLMDLDKASVTLFELYAMAETVCVETQSRFVLRDEEAKFVVHSDWTCSFCCYTLFRSFRCTFNYHAGLGKDFCCQKLTITISTPK